MPGCYTESKPIKNVVGENRDVKLCRNWPWASVTLKHLPETYAASFWTGGHFYFPNSQISLENVSERGDNGKFRVRVCHP